MNEYLIEKYLGEMTMTQKIENNIRDHLSGTDRKVDKKGMWNLVKSGVNGSKESDFNKVWNSLIDDDFLIKKGKYYIWEM